MSRTVFLDSGPLGELAHRRGEGVVTPASSWLFRLVAAGVRVIVPEITDYEVRRELLRIRATKSLELLETVLEIAEYLPLTTDAMRRAAALWAEARRTGRQTAGDADLDADVILVGQAESLQLTDAIIATTNVRHIGRFFPADLWSNVTATSPAPPLA